MGWKFRPAWRSVRIRECFESNTNRTKSKPSCESAVGSESAADHPKNKKGEPIDRLA